MITCIIQARMGSTRLPGKTMEKITKDKRVIDFVVEQLKFSKIIEKIIVAIPDSIEDDVTYNHLLSKKIQTYRGSLKNVLGRFSLQKIFCKYCSFFYAFGGYYVKIA